MATPHGLAYSWHMYKYLIVLFGLVSAPSFALETDNYLTWGMTLNDSGERLNAMIKEQIDDVLVRANAGGEVSCREITFRIAKRFKTTPGKKLFEDWSADELGPDSIYPTTSFYLGESIFQDTPRFYLKYSGLSPSVQVNGIYFGVDKLSHFGSTGRRYLKHYLKKLRQGFSEEEATRSAIRLGLSNEAGILGIWPSGVYSYGDIEANYQGFVFYKKLCLDTQNSYLKLDEKKQWQLIKEPKIQNYVNPYWDETFNPSFFADVTWERAADVLKRNYCEKFQTPEVIERNQYYQKMGSSHQSYSLNYVNLLKSRNLAPLPQDRSFEALCL